MTLPKVKAETVESIIQEVYTKNTEFGIKDFESKLETENIELACVLYSFLDSICDSVYILMNTYVRKCALSVRFAVIFYTSLYKNR